MHTFNALAFIFFCLGLALHALAQIDAIARAKNNPAGSRLSIFTARWIPILVRSAISAAFFTLWLQGELADTLIAVGVSIPDWGKRVLDLHVGAAVALVAGFAFDSILGYIPFLKSSVPPPIDALQAVLADAADKVEVLKHDADAVTDAVAAAQAIAPTTGTPKP